MLLTLVFAVSYPGVVLDVGESGSQLRIAQTEGKRTPFGPDATYVKLALAQAPRQGQRYGREAALFMRDLALGEAVIVEDGRVRMGKVQLDEALVKAGLAWAKDKSLLALQEEAKAAKRGLWADGKPLEPWRFKELTLLRDAPNKQVHADWECPFVQETQCKDCGGGRYYDWAEVKKEGFAPHAECLKGEKLAIAQATGAVSMVPAPAARRECASDDDCAIVPQTPCSCMGCGSVKQHAARNEVVKRMQANYAKASCIPPGCPACAGHLSGTKAVCVNAQCEVR